MTFTSLAQSDSIWENPKGFPNKGLGQLSFSNITDLLLCFYSKKLKPHRLSGAVCGSAPCVGNSFGFTHNKKVVCLLLVVVQHLANTSQLLKPIFHCDAKYLALGVGVGQCPDARILRWRYQHVGIFWRYLTLKFASPPTPNLEFAFSPMRNPNANQWNIGGVGYSGVGMYFMLFVHHFPRWLREN